MFFNTAHIGEAGAFPQALTQFREIRRGARRVDFHAAIVQIAGVAGELELGSDALDEVTEADTLHASTDEIEPGCGVRYSHGRLGTPRSRSCTRSYKYSVETVPKDSL